MANNNLTIYCLFEGDAPSQPFSVTAQTTTTVEELKDIIKTKNPQRLASTDAAQLTLWRVSVTEDDDDLKVLLDRIPPDQRKKLGTRVRLEAEFTDVLPESTVVVVQVPIVAISAPIVKPIVVAHFGPKIKKTFHYTESETTMHALRSLLRSVFNLPHGTTDDQISIKTKADGAFLLSDEALRRAVTPKFEIVVETAQIAFSDWKYSQVKSLFDISADTFQDLPEFKAEYFDISDKYSKAAIKHIMEDLRRRLISFSASPVMNEATSREFISCILSGITSCYDGDIKLFPEYKVAGSHGKGPLDWAIKKGDTIIGVTEAKRLDMEQGVAQNLVQLQTSAQLNKSKRAKDEDDLEMIYGIVTTGYYWVILRLIVNGGEVQVHKSNCKCIQLLLDVDSPDKDQVAVENLFQQIRWLLEEQILIHTLPKFEKRRRLSQDSNP